MIKSFWKFLKYIERWEYHEPSSFWFATISLWLIIHSFSILSHGSELSYSSNIAAREAGLLV